MSSGPTLPGGRFTEITRFAVIDSTNRYLLDQARAGAPAGLVAVADHQQAGRGRWGRRWEAPPGSGLLCSVLLRPVLPPDRLFLVTAAVALSAADACTAVAGVTPGIKWPNDLVVGDAKLAGVLAEVDFAAPGGPPGSTAVVVGLGLNLTTDGPPGVGGTSLSTLGGHRGGAGQRDGLLDALLASLDGRLTRLESGPAGRADLVAEFRRACVTLGRRVRVELADRVVEGEACDLTEAGHLVVSATGADGPTQRVELAVGDVVHLRPAGP